MAPPRRARGERKLSVAKALLITILIFLNILLAFLLGLNFKNTPGSFRRLVNSLVSPLRSSAPEKPPSDELTPAVTQQPPAQIPLPVAEENTVPAAEMMNQEHKPDAAVVKTDQTAPVGQPLPVPPAEPAAAAQALPEQPNKAISAKPGDIISALATKEYGTLTDTIFDIIKRANPGIEDLNMIYVGDTVILPPLDIESLVMQNDDGTFSIHLATFPSDADGLKLQEAFSNNHYKISMRPVKILGNQAWQRVTLGYFPDRASAIEYIRAVDVDSALFPFPVDVIHRSLKSMRSTY
jgi:phage tail protein X